MVIAAAIAAAGVLIIRSHHTALVEPWLLAGALSLPLFTTSVVWMLSRRDFIHVGQALVRLEMQLGLHAALTTAHAGAGSWPDVPGKAPDGLRWRWLRAGIPPALALALITTAWLLPVKTRAVSAFEVSEPSSWTIVESDLDQLVERELVDESTTEQTRKAIEALRERPKSEWFDHSSIEAGDRIMQAHRRDMTDLQNRLREAAQALRQAARARQGLESALPSANNPFGDILNELGMGQLSPNAELMDQLEKLRDANNGALGQLDPRQLAELLDNLEQNAELLDEMLEKFNGMPNPCGNCGKCGRCNGNGKGRGNGERQPGNGGINRGPGEGGPLFGDSRDLVDPSLQQPLPAGDLSRAAPGDMVGVGETEHDIDTGISPELRAGGTPTRQGDGGGAVWNDSLLPSEQQALERYFD